MDWFMENLGNIIEDILDAVFDSMGGELSYVFGTGLWNMMIGLITTTAGTTPEQFSSTAWNYVTNVVYDGCLSVAAMILNVMYLIGLMRQAVKLRENYTAEMLVDALIKVIIANFGLVNGLTIMKQFFGLAATLSTALLGNNSGLYFEQQEHDLGSVFFFLLFGILYFIVSLVCSALIFLAVYSRYILLYFLVGVAPFAWVTLPGGSGVSNTFFAWLKTFLAKTLEIVAMAILIGIGSALCKKIDFGSIDGIGQGAIQAVQNLATMVLITASIKGVDITMRRVFGL